MTAKIVSALLLTFSASIANAQNTIQQSNAHIGFTYPISTNGVHAAEYDNKFSLHVIAGVSHSEKAFCASGAANIIKDSATGFIGAGVVNYVGNATKGAQAAGFINYTKTSVTGFQGAGFLNVAGSVKGVQAAGFTNVATKAVTGVQVAGFANAAKGATTQAAGFVNVTDSTHAQFAGFANVSKRITGGAQVAGFANVTTDIQGTQVAGFINVAHKVTGAQVSGFINIADSCDYPIGLVNIIKKGEKSLGVLIDETGTTFATFRSGGRILYGIIGAGFNGSHFRAIYAQQAGLGAHLPISRTFRLSGEATFTSFIGKNAADFQTGIRVFPSVKVWNLELYAGPSFNYALSSLPGAPFNHNSLWSESDYYNTHELYVGMVCGLQFYF